MAYIILSIIIISVVGTLFSFVNLLAKRDAKALEEYYINNDKRKFFDE